MERQLSSLIKQYRSLKAEYEIQPSTFLQKMIELTEKKIKAIAISLGKTSDGGRGNYPSCF